MMDDLAQRLIYKAPVLLLAVALALFIGGLVNAWSTIQTIQQQGQEIRAFQYLFSFFLSALYQPAVLIGGRALYVADRQRLPRMTAQRTVGGI